MESKGPWPTKVQRRFIVKLHSTQKAMKGQDSRAPARADTKNAPGMRNC